VVDEDLDLFNKDLYLDGVDKEPEKETKKKHKTPVIGIGKK
jgi:hypothetical protein